MEQRIEYKGYIISSAPLPLQGGRHSSNGSIEQHTSAGVTVTIKPDLQAISFATEEEAHDHYVENAKKLIDQLNQN